METYIKAYQNYMKKCEQFGIKELDFGDFMKTLTNEQIQTIVSHLN